MRPATPTPWWRTVPVLLLLLAAVPHARGARLQDTPATGPESKSETLRILTERLDDAIIGKRYHLRLAATGGTPPYRWRVRTPYLPEGLMLDQSTGEIAGTPRSDGLSDFTIEVKDSGSPAQTAVAYFILAVVEPLVLWTQPMPPGMLRTPYRVHLRARGGTLPYRWELLGGSLPPGLKLDARGRLTGIPARAGAFRFIAQVRDAGRPAQVKTATFIARMLAPLTVDWSRPPRVQSGGIYGSVRVANDTEDDFDLTVIVVAINDYGKAFALGYKQFVLEKKSVSDDIPFGFGLPQGEYVVHVDAVAEVREKNLIYRDRRQRESFQVD